MDTERERHELEKTLRQSRAALPIETVFGAVGVGVLLAIHWLFGMSTWLVWALGFFCVVGAVVDANNIRYCRRRLRRLDVENPM